MFELWIKTSAIKEKIYSYNNIDNVSEVFSSIIVSLLILNGENIDIICGRWNDYFHFNGLTEIEQEKIIKCVKDSLNILLNKE